MRNKCCFIIVYFGKLPKQFPMFLKTCATNTDFNWLLFTDDNTSYKYPQNVNRYLMTFTEFKDLAEEKFGFPLSLEKPYKLCDLKPMYGFILEDYIQGFDFWGHTDIDTIMGDLATFITDDLLDQYDKLFIQGHFIIYRNSTENNRVFMRQRGEEYIYKTVLQTPEICWFDEEYKNDRNVNQIFLEQNRRVFQEDWSVNFHTKRNGFQRVICKGADADHHFLGYEVESPEKYLYIWDHGHIYRQHIVDGVLSQEEMMYMHFQHRKMRYSDVILAKDWFKIVPNSFKEIKKIPSTKMEYLFTPKCILQWDYSKKWCSERLNRIVKKIECNWKAVTKFTES